MIVHECDWCGTQTKSTPDTWKDIQIEDYVPGVNLNELLCTQCMDAFKALREDRKRGLQYGGARQHK